MERLIERIAPGGIEDQEKSDSMVLSDAERTESHKDKSKRNRRKKSSVRTAKRKTSKQKVKSSNKNLKLSNSNLKPLKNTQANKPEGSR